MKQVVKVAGVQMEPKLLDKEHNLSKCLETMYLTAGKGARLVVFPECALSGYVFSSLEEALPVAEPIPGPSTERIIAACRELNIFAVVGLLERDGDKCYNAAVLLGPEGLVGKHRKAHLPDLGIDRFLHPGDLPFTVYDTGIGKIGIAICYEACFPEHTRILALQGAEIVVLPTNWPDWPVVRVIRDLLVPARAAENFVYFIAADRIGEERDITFLGGSRIVGIGGAILAEVKEHEEGVIFADLDLTETQDKMGLLSKRRPDLYGLIVQEMSHSPSSSA